MAKIKAEKMNLYYPYFFKDTVYLDCPDCGEEYEWLSPLTVSGLYHDEEPDLRDTCRFFNSVPQEKCIKCQVKLRLEQAQRKHNAQKR